MKWAAKGQTHEFFEHLTNEFSFSKLDSMPTNSVFHDRKITNGARRILERLKSHIAETAATNASFFSLLFNEILCEENRATELLNLSDSVVEQFKINTSNQPSTTLEPFPEWQLRLLRHADRFAIQTSDEAVTGTEHLLLALLELDPVTQKFLNEHGIKLESLLENLATPEPQLNIEPDHEIIVKPMSVGAIEGPALHRILDASANRCREGLRVVEDFVRFALDDAFLSRKLKELRHQITEVLRHLKQEEWIAARDTTNDVGTKTTTNSEAYRGTTLDVVRASMKRIEEALRSLEEYSKLIDVELSSRLEASRYFFYTIEKTIEANLSSRQRLFNKNLYLLVTAENCRYGIETTVRDSTAKGVDIVQLREKSLSDRQLIDLGKKVREWTYEHEALFIMNDRPDLAVACGADGVHLGQDDMAIHEARKVVGTRLIIGVSTHNLEQVQNAVYQGADYLGVGPTFPSQTKNFEDFAGLKFVEQVSKETSLPWYAIGGIDSDNLGQVLQAGASRIAVSATICAAANPRGVVSDLAEKLASKSDVIKRVSTKNQEL
jgi:thiamine-phosphate pyrophosphorylase